ncbi:MAG: hypothetical protein NC311_16015 [Muribaculaceae bacterium]|nr:hypothetical protein [Muribaculaceae bacterium]
MDRETAKAINNLSKRLNDVERKLEEFLLAKHEENREAISTTDGGVVDIAEIVSTHDEAIAELAEIVADGMMGE